MTPITATVTEAYISLTTAIAALRDHMGDDRGEGVISTAIAVLIMAFLGAAMWVGFNEIWADSKTAIDGQISEIGG